MFKVHVGSPDVDVVLKFIEAEFDEGTNVAKSNADGVAEFTVTYEGKEIGDAEFQINVGGSLLSEKLEFEYVDGGNVFLQKVPEFKVKTPDDFRVRVVEPTDEGPDQPVEGVIVRIMYCDDTLLIARTDSNGVVSYKDASMKEITIFVNGVEIDASDVFDDPGTARIIHVEKTDEMAWVLAPE